MSVLYGYEPARVFYYFEKLCAIPHGSGNTDAVSDFCVDFAKQHGLWFKKDEYNNVIIKKAASKGYENRQSIILQGHLDMVCEKVQDKKIDFSKEGITVMSDGEYIFADGTTLGADNGIAVAMVLAVLEDDRLAHPMIEAVFTTDEETGMFGALGIDVSVLSSKRLINIDSEAEGVMTVSCAGGARADISLPLKRDTVKRKCVRVSLSGLSGGHSGVEIDKGRLNADITLARFLNGIGGEFFISDLSGGFKDNAIPRSAECVISTTASLESLAESFVKENALGENSELKVAVTDAGEQAVFEAACSKRMIELICSLKNGVQKMSEDINGLVQTSLNLGVMKIEGDAFCATVSVRSSVNSEKLELLEDIRSTALSFGAEFKDKSHYPAWEYKKDSSLQSLMCSAYKKLYAKDMRIEAIHAGLECGLFCDKINGLDAVSIGPDMYDIHTPAERLSVASVGRIYRYIRTVLEEME